MAKPIISADSHITEPPNTYVDRIDANRVAEFHERMVERLHSEISDVLQKIGEGDWSDETQKALDDAIGQFARDFGYDLDEEGLPLTDEQAIREGRGDRDEDEAEETEETEEKEEAATTA